MRRTMDANILHSIPPNPLRLSESQLLIGKLSFPHGRRTSISMPPTRCTTGDSGKSDNGSETMQQPQELGLRFRRGSRRRMRKQQRTREDGGKASPPPPAPRKEWEQMSLMEKALELYIGEKGALFWLNKFAYASIFMVIGAWILFRFVGPALNLYQLDSPPLSPTSMFKG